MRRMMTAREVSEYTQIPIRTIYNKTKCGDLPCYRIGRSIRYKVEEIDMAMKGGTYAKKSETESRSIPV
jgi:excisionase family DNA binding protein